MDFLILPIQLNEHDELEEVLKGVLNFSINIFYDIHNYVLVQERVHGVCSDITIL